MTTWHNVIVWGKPGETCSKYLHKGAKVLVEGEISHRKYTDKTGVERHVTEIVSWSHVEFVQTDKEKQQGGQQSNVGSNAGVDDIPF